MTIQIVKQELQAELYVRKQLSRGTTLARLVLQAIDFARGRFRIVMPPGTDQSVALDFSSSNINLAGDKPIAFARVIKWFLQDSNCSLLIQDTEASMSDPWLQEFEHKNLAIPYDGELYWKVAGPQLASLSDDEMLDVVNGASFFSFTAFFYLRPVPETAIELNYGDLNHVKRNLVGLAIGAFDFESFLLWWRDDLYPFPTANQADSES